MSPSELVRMARSLVNDTQAATRFVWAPAVVHLTRQALERAIDAFYGARPATAGLIAAPWHHKLVCLRFYDGHGLDQRRAEEAAWCWSALSDAAHHRGMAGVPSTVDVLSWLASVEALVQALTPA